MHCHLDLYSKPSEVAQQCSKRGMYVLSVTTTPKAWKGTSQLAADNLRVSTALGLHPQLAHDRFQELELFDEILPSAGYVGEIGLDGGKSFLEHKDIQLKVFRHILNSLQRVGGRVMSVHSRASAGVVLSELHKYSEAGLAIMHWFTGTAYDLKRAINQNCWFSVGPAMLMTKRGKELIMSVPRNLILPETDGPFAMQNNVSLMPWDVRNVYRGIALLWGIPETDVESQLFDNFGNLVEKAAHG